MPDQRSNRLLNLLRSLFGLRIFTDDKRYRRFRRAFFYTLSGLLTRYFAIGGRTTERDISRKIILDGKVTVAGVARYVSVLKLAKQGWGIFGSDIFIAFKLNEYEPDFPFDRSGAFYDTVHSERLAPGVERLGDQVFFFTFSRWKNVERNYQILGDFVRDEYIDPRDRSIENAYFREILLSYNNDNTQGEEFII